LEANSKTRAAKPAGDSSKERATEEVGAFMVLMTITTAMRRTPLSKCVGLMTIQAGCLPYALI
jgi:hypothetical protein